MSIFSVIDNEWYYMFISIFGSVNSYNMTLIMNSHFRSNSCQMFIPNNWAKIKVRLHYQEVNKLRFEVDW